ncbi:MAG: hypothetical protein KGJ09_10750 [Candidatus Omnitrophica bacterium]|nr:hypothetical protein [Candidatus Omnitrophota bacterium]MDE2215513.1 hypothetical protein [Candidatus Omnitrophota bacterium]
MNLTPAQLKRFWREWSATCRSKGWLTEVDKQNYRRQILRQCGFESLTQVDRTDGFTRVLNEIISMRGTSIQAARETEDPTLNQARILRHNIAAEIIPCLELYIQDVPAYLQQIMADKTRWHKTDRPSREIRIEDLDAGQLKQLQYTLSARLNTLRNTAGHTIHDMRKAASLDCHCSRCIKASVTLPPALANTPKPEEANSSAPLCPF